MLDKKLQGGKPDEDCYKLLKMMEKQAGIRKHKDWLVQEQTALGKDFSNPLMADNLPKIVWLSTHHICPVLPLIIEEAPKKTKEQLLQEEASLAEAIRLDNLKKEEEANTTKDSLKRFGEEFQTKTSKRLKSDEAKGDESTKKAGKRRKQIARKGLHSDKTDEDEFEASKDDDPILGTDIPIHPVPVAIKPPSIATYMIIKQGEKGVYQIVREDGTDIVYINFWSNAEE
ncbi:hypothetical protein Tco_0365092 [Tanacetum coccineum]